MRRVRIRIKLRTLAAIMDVVKRLLQAGQARELSGIRSLVMHSVGKVVCDGTI
jgi:hypothetical protein